MTQAVAVSVTHYMDRDGNFLAEISPRRYFCEQCHVAQVDAKPLVDNRFEDVDEITAHASRAPRPAARRSRVKTLHQAGQALLGRHQPAERHFSLGFLTIGGFIAGVVFWGGFNTAMELTNTETFCIGCHEMRDNVYAELQRTIHYTNRSGVRAKCSDCHVPHDWTDKIARKMQASKEVWGKIFGTIDTPREVRGERLELAQHEWARLKANDSLECRNCHGSTTWTSRAAPGIHKCCCHSVTAKVCQLKRMASRRSSSVVPMEAKAACCTGKP